jgi:trans-aconitate methyltransferase
VSERRPVVEDGVIAGNYEDKQATRNPLARWLVRRFEDALLACVARTGARDVHEVGCGEGSLLRRLAAPGRRLRGCDFSTQIVAEARRRTADLDVELAVRSVHDLEAATDAAELVVCCEVLEHLAEPERALRRLVACARPWLLVSVPREPLWRALNCARGKYWSDLGNTPGHLQHWSRGSFLRLLRESVDVVEARSPLPWTVALCRSRTSGA